MQETLWNQALIEHRTLEIPMEIIMPTHDLPKGSI